MDQRDLGLPERYQNIIFAGLIVLIAAGVLLLMASRPAPVQMVVEPPAPTATPGAIQVYVTGAVANPDVYSLAWDARIKDAIAAAGVLETADLVRINLAQRLHDGDHIHVPDATDPGAPAAGAPVPEPSGGPININTASRDELDALYGIGPSLAQRIIDYREANGPFETIEDIMNVRGIGESTFDKIADRITVE
ncbi:MAG: helix-hairpin-helix domain-containing protein [Anaerolineae bacterium]|nr:helix-hairpin-helix domain-containing protein [Anaerolineae bacterium]